MNPYNKPSPQDCLAHYGIKGMKWGVRRYQNKDGDLTSAGKKRYSGLKTAKKIGKVVTDSTKPRGGPDPIKLPLPVNKDGWTLTKYPMGTIKNIVGRDKPNLKIGKPKGGPEPIKLPMDVNKDGWQPQKQPTVDSLLKKKSTMLIGKIDKKQVSRGQSCVSEILRRIKGDSSN